MHRDELINEVKDEYARIASMESQQHSEQMTTDTTPEAYYEKLLGKAISEISSGTFDGFKSGKDVVNAIANDKSWISN